MPDKSLRFAFFGNEYQAKKSATMQKMVDLLRQHGAQICIDRPYYVFLTKVLHLDIDMTDVFLNTIDVLLIFIDLTVDCHQVVQAFGHISLVLLERLFLLSDLTLNVSALVSQLLYRGIGDIIVVSRHTFS